MNKSEFLNDKFVTDFINWLSPKLNISGEFNHAYHILKTNNDWQCSSIYNAYEKYEWRFTTIMPDGRYVKGNTYHENELLLSELEYELKNALEQGNQKSFTDYSISLLKWGGVKTKNDKRLYAMDSSIIEYFLDTQHRLNPDMVDTQDNFDSIIMNSGFTKIYSLIINDFAIYDSRVGAALALLVRLYLEDNAIMQIPPILHFAYGNSRTANYNNKQLNRRNPSSDIYKFKQLANNHKRHIDNNIRANWLIKELACNSVFSNGKNSQRALEAALFMIGYDVRSYLETVSA